MIFLKKFKIDAIFLSIFFPLILSLVKIVHLSFPHNLFLLLLFTYKKRLSQAVNLIAFGRIFGGKLSDMVLKETLHFRIFFR